MEILRAAGSLNEGSQPEDTDYLQGKTESQESEKKSDTALLIMWTSGSCQDFPWTYKYLGQ